MHPTNRSEARRVLAATWLTGLLGALLLAATLLPAADAAETRLVIGQTFIADGVDSARGSNGWALTTHGVGETLFTVNQAGAIIPLLAESVTPTEDGGWHLKLATGRSFSDGSPVTADDVATSLERTNEENPAARASGGRMTLHVVDRMSLDIKTARPVPIMASVLAEWPMVIHKLVGGEPLYTGPYKIASFAAGDSMTLAPNPHYPGADDRTEILLKKFADSQALALAFESGELDMAFNLPVEALPRLRARTDLTIKSFPVAYQYLMWINQRRPALADPRVRRALDLGIDRDLLVQAVNGGAAATGAFAGYFPFAAKMPRPFDPEKAAVLLDEAGWHRGDDGIRRKDGEALKLTLTAYPQRPDLVTFQPVIKALYRDLGVQLETRISEAVTQVATSGDFDLLLWAQHSAPAGDPAFFLNMFFRSGAGNNHTGYASARYDAILDRIAATIDPAARADLAREAQQTLFADTPAAFLMTPDWHVGLSKRLAHYEPWGSDYYIIRPDLTVGE